MGNVEPPQPVRHIKRSDGFGTDWSYETEFRSFVVENELRIHRAFVAAYGAERGREATAEALAYAWEHWQQLKSVENIPGFLYRVGQSRTRPRKHPVTFELAPELQEQLVEPGLRAALTNLSTRQRVAVVLIHGYGWTIREVADYMGLRTTSVQNHLERGLRKLRRQIGEESL
jgi:DNA-directed RNA polymerase specialized sigma24 family protein